MTQFKPSEVMRFSLSCENYLTESGWRRLTRERKLRHQGTNKSLSFAQLSSSVNRLLEANRRYCSTRSELRQRLTHDAGSSAKLIHAYDGYNLQNENCGSQTEFKYFITSK